MNASATGSILILGIGNLLWADEGFGVRCVEALEAGWALPEPVTLMDGGTQGLYLLPYVTAAERLIVFDAIDYGLAPGTLRLVEGEDVPRFMGAKKMSLHQTGFQEVLASAALLGRLPREMLLIGVQPAELEDYGGSLRPVVRERVPAAVEFALARLAAWGIQAVRREADADGRLASRSADERSDGEVPPRVNDAALAIDQYEGRRPAETEACRRGDLRFVTVEG